MKNIKKFVALLTVVGVLGISGIVYAADLKTPADIAATVTGQTLDQVTQERAEGKTYGTIAQEAGKLNEFKTQMLEQKKTVLEQRVKDGTLTQQQADQILTRIQNNQALCDGTGNAGIGQGTGAGFGQGKGNGLGRGNATGNGSSACNGSGYGSGMGMGRI
ncbi:MULTISPECIES: DUF2680 domain-containing protein [unclassified Dehalobacter]|uniref:DUF2680 domain-containing protein n=1 Tax=unclassified Dehalobacter TaxID=2635733 RepID=UPI000E6C1F6E|nr:MULTISPECIES: DUF2680 domain-containing protein [unclassified Dehalobacter]RJE49171.1 hypothetical protein A7K50_06530 [Dehalobacter sp. MCB1]TCX53211.1 hypothetical protein C1I36_00160 [Dehalobacter sp. 14DCB1]TCX54225.1 hypothetical protein C1I38_05545 [Dehalobacter sp. 12DCB1]